MVKLGKNKLKKLNKLTKKQNASPSNKIIKKKHNLEKKVTFQKEILLKESVKTEDLVKTVKSKTDMLKNLSRNSHKNIKEENKVITPKLKPVEKKKKRQKTQVCDTKLILNLMKKKFNDNRELGNMY